MFHFLSVDDPGFELLMNAVRLEIEEMKAKVMDELQGPFRQALKDKLKSLKMEIMTSFESKLDALKKERTENVKDEVAKQLKSVNIGKPKEKEESDYDVSCVQLLIAPYLSCVNDFNLKLI